MSQIMLRPQQRIQPIQPVARVQPVHIVRRRVIEDHVIVNPVPVAAETAQPPMVARMLYLYGVGLTVLVILAFVTLLLGVTLQNTVAMVIGAGMLFCAGLGVREAFSGSMSEVRR